MKNVETVTDSSQALGSQVTDTNKASPFVWVLDATAISLLSVALYFGLDSWKNWFSSPDRKLFSVCVFMGIMIAIVRSNWRGQQTSWKICFAWAFLVVACLLICASAAVSNPILGGIACGAVLAAWCIGRIRGESVFNGIFLGSMFVLPFLIDSMENRGDFEQLKSFTVTVTSLLADAVSQPNARDEGTVLFVRGIADHFSTIGALDSVLGLFGVAMFCTLAFRRCLMASCLTLTLSVFAWIAVRSIAWVTLAYLANRNETWYSWSFELEIGLFLIGCALVFSLDQFSATIFKPSPFDYFNPESPLGAFAWNWLCGLPNLVLRIPKQNKIVLRWKARLRLAGKKSSFYSDCKWMKIEFLDLLFNPMRAIGSLIDAVRAWRYSRRWKRFFSHLPAFALLLAVYTSIAFASSKRTESHTQFLSRESERLCATETLEAACKELQESDFCKVIGANYVLNAEALTALPDTTKRQVEFQSKRILSAEPKNQIARYRLGMIYALSGKTKEAMNEMDELTGGKSGEFPPADAWLAKALIGLRVDGQDVSIPDLLRHLDNARKWNQIDSRLPFVYARMLEERGEISKAVFVVQKAVDAEPKFRLELAKLYTRVGDHEGRRKAANQAEEYFLLKTNSENENESDRLAVADARLLAERPQEAIAILEEGLRHKLGGEKTRRKLSDIRLALYQESIRKGEDGKYSLDLSLLEKAAESDSENPAISSEIAGLLQYNVRLPEASKLLEVMKKQIALNIVSVPSLLIIGEEYFKKGELKNAQYFWELAFNKEPENFTVLNNLATCLVAIAPSNAERALELVTKAIAISPNNADILDTWGEVLVAAKRPKEAINKYELAIRKDTNRLDTRKKYLAVLLSLGMDEDARVQEKIIREMELANSKSLSEKNAQPNTKPEK